MGYILSIIMAILAVLLGLAIAAVLVIWTVVILGSMDHTDGCIYRYNFAEDGSILNSDVSVRNVTLQASGNYNISGSTTPSPGSYGKWLNSNIKIKDANAVKFKVKGEVSLCKAYLPAHNLQSVSDRDIAGDKIAIPRIEDETLSPLSLIFDAKTPQWRNITEIFRNDKLVVSISPDRKTTSPSTTIYDSVNKNNIVADCREGYSSYNPICGRYSIYGGDYVSTCNLNLQCYECNCRQVCDGIVLFGACLTLDFPRVNLGFRQECDWCSCYQNTMKPAPEPYANDGIYTSPRYESISELMTNFNPDCGANSSYVLSDDYQLKKYFWFSADSATGLLYRFDDSVDPTAKESRGSNYSFAKIQDDQSFYNNDPNFKILLNTTYDTDDVAYLQYRFHGNDSQFADNTGGYVLNIKQTKCRRDKGIGMNDVIQNRGAIEYIITADKDPNDDMTGLSMNELQVNTEGVGEFVPQSGQKGNLWLRVKNHPDDYQDSIGQYQIDISTITPRGNFIRSILNPLFEGFKSKIRDASTTIFKNMTCYQGTGGQGDCTNFFNYIRAILTLYIMIYGMMFLLGMVSISQSDIVIRVIKVAFIAGLLNEKTFEFFNLYVFDFAFGFSDSVIANMSGYSFASDGQSITNPFTFATEVLNKILFSKTFIAQIIAMPTMGAHGIMYFLIVAAAIVVLLIVLFRAMAVYLMAFLAVAILLALAPIFLTFMLFERTWSIFDNWIRYTFRYMIEPLVMLAGIIILTQLFTIYLDNVVGYSVCWKCVIPFKLPFSPIGGILPSFLDVEFFCLSWFAPWGFDPGSDQMGLSLQNMIVLVLIVFSMWGYLDFSSKIVAKLSAAHGPSATSIGKELSNEIEQAIKNAPSTVKKIRAEAKQFDSDMSQLGSALKSTGKSRSGGIPKGQGKQNSGKSGSKEPSGGNENPPEKTIEKKE